MTFQTEREQPGPTGEKGVTRTHRPPGPNLSTGAWNRKDLSKDAQALMSYMTYKLIHLFGLFALFVALAGMAVHAAAGHEKSENTSYKGLLILHGIGALVALTGGFGLLARVGAASEGGLPGWVWAKLVLWLLVGGLIAVPYRNRSLAKVLIFVLPFLGLLGAFLGDFKPF